MPRRRRSAVLPFLVLAVTACGDDLASPTPPEVAASRSAAQCMNVDVEIQAPLGLWSFDGALVPGGVPSPVSMDGIQGWLGSILSPDMTTHGRSETVHWTLRHVFATGAPSLVESGLGFPVLAIDLTAQSSWFMTEDRAVCAAAGGGTALCRVNDQLRVVAGEGVFANAGGFLHNHGWITLTDPATGAGTGDFHARGRVCGAGL